MFPSLTALRSVRADNHLSDEPLQCITSSSDSALLADQIEKERYEGKVFVRQGIIARLKKAAKILQEYDSNLALEVISGYRSLAGQIYLFEQQMNQLKQDYPSESYADLEELCHQSVAHPDVAGHTTGGAVDLHIIDRHTGVALNFGTQPWDFSEASAFFYQQSSYEVVMNRNILRSVMMLSGFVPFEPEWWHFSFGDAEWAYWKGCGYIYAPIADHKNLFECQ